jgi:hypothetical protein
VRARAPDEVGYGGANLEMAEAGGANKAGGARARTGLAMSAPSEQDFQRLRVDREVALLRKFLAGVVLPPEAMIDLAHVLPPEVLANPPEAQPGYLKPYAHYAGLLGVTERQVKRLVSTGRHAVGAVDFPPFDEPEKFLAWWVRRMKTEPSPRVRAFAATGKKDPAPSSTAPGTATPGETGKTETPASTAPRFNLAAAGGFAESVRELRMTVAAAQLRLRTVMTAEPLDESLVASCNRAVREQLDLLRKSENDLFEFQQRRGELVPRTEVREDWRTLLAAMRQMRRRMEANVEATLATTGLFSPDQLQAVRAAVAEERSREDQLLRGSKFWRANPDDVSAASAVAA